MVGMIVVGGFVCCTVGVRVVGLVVGVTVGFVDIEGANDTVGCIVGRTVGAAMTVFVAPVTVTVPEQDPDR
jgi:hypothetical protein